MNQSSTLFVGLDVHKGLIAVAHTSEAFGEEVTYEGTVGTAFPPCPPLGARGARPTRAANVTSRSRRDSCHSRFGFFFFRFSGESDTILSN
jgi:hypothetical protein